MTRAETSGRFDLDRATFDALVDHARSDAPYEVCGLLAADSDGRVVAHYPIANASRSITYYSMDATEMLHAFNDMDDRDLDLVAIYHSHTHTEAFPSRTDVELAAYPDACYLIVSLAEPEAPIIRGFDIIDAQITERTVYLDGAEAPAGAR